MDFGFLRASSDVYQKMKNETRIVRSHNGGNNSYLLIVDAATRFCWMFPTPSKHPPIGIVNQFLASQKLTTGPRHILTNQGGNLYDSAKFCAIVSCHGYVAL